MESTRQIKVTLFDKNFNRIGWVNDFESITVTERFLALSTGEITVSAQHSKLDRMLEPGARVTVELYIGSAQLAAFDQGTNSQGHTLITGPLRAKRGSYLSSGSVTFQIEGDWRILRNFRAYPVPAGHVTASSLTDAAQSWNVGAAPAAGEDAGRSGYYQWPWTSGPIDVGNVLSRLIGDNVNARWSARFGSDLISLPGSAGADVFPYLPQVRFGTIEQYAVPLLVAAGVGMRILLRDQGFYVPARPNRWRMEASYWTPTVWPVTLTPESGTIRDGDWSLDDPQVTDVIVGGPGDLSARAFASYSDLDTSLEYRDIIEVFREATGAPVQWPTTLDEKYRMAKYYLLRPEITADQKAAFTKFLDDGAADVFEDGKIKMGLSVKLAESEGFRFTGFQSGQNGFKVGDIVTVAPSIAAARARLSTTERITEVTVSQSSDGGVSVTPQVGAPLDDPDVTLALSIQALARANARRSTSQ